jgi:hypothetical protein
MAEVSGSGDPLSRLESARGLAGFQKKVNFIANLCTG